MPSKTRLNASTQISVAFGTGEQFLVSELPTNRDVIRYGILLGEDCDDIKKINYPVKEMAKDLLPALLHQWSSANLEFYIT